MKFLKKLFSSKEQKKDVKENLETKGIIIDDYFEKRYNEEIVDDTDLSNSLSVIDKYFSINGIERKIEKFPDHPINLDQVAKEGTGFIDFCQTFGKASNETIVFYLAFPLSNFLINNFGFKLYNDSEPENPLRSMALIYNKNNYLLTLYPYEYSLKVLNSEAEFEKLLERVKDNLNNLPNENDMFDKFMESLNE